MILLKNMGPAQALGCKVVAVNQGHLGLGWSLWDQNSSYRYKALMTASTRDSKLWPAGQIRALACFCTT